MTTRWRIEALAVWPYPETPARQSSAVFRACWEDTLLLLRDEADRVGAVEPIVVQLVCDPAELRVDGMLKARAHVAHPGVILTLTTATGPLVFASDQYDQRYTGTLVGWQANVRAIALGMGALRAVDRYGITRAAEQYTGFRALEAGPSAGSSVFGSADEALRWLATLTGLPADVPARRLLRRASALTFPDRHDDDRSVWDRVDAARQLLTRAGLL